MNTCMRGMRVLGASWTALVASIVIVTTAAPVASGPLAQATDPVTTAAPSAPGATTVDRLATVVATPLAAARPEPRRFARHLLVHVPRPLVARAHPRHDARPIGTVEASSKYYQVPMVAWVERVSRGGRWGLVELPYVWPRRDGWIALGGLRRESTSVEVRVDLSRHRLTVYRRDEAVVSFPAAIGAPTSPTPPGEYAVTDRIPFPGGGYLGSFAFGISGIQPNLPPGWSGGNQLAIHGTNDPSSIGRSVSAGCLRVSEAALARLRPLLQLGTPVVIVR